MLSLHRPEHRDRDEIDHRYFDRFGHNSGVFFEDLALDSRGERLYDARMMDMRGVGSSHDVRRRGAGPRPIVPGRQPSAHPRSGWADDYHEHRPRPTMVASRKDAMPFRGAMNKLFHQIEQARECYSEFQSQYDNEVFQIKNYATQKVLDELWGLRVAGKKDRRTLEEGESITDEDSHEKPKEMFNDTRERMRRALEHAVYSTIQPGQESRKNAIRHEAAKRLQRKVATAQDQIMELLTSAPKGREDCDELLKELELLRILVDPENERNKQLYKAGDDGDGNVGGSDDEGGNDLPQGREGEGGWENYD